jgi:hypothetical protein
LIELGSDYRVVLIGGAKVRTQRAASLVGLPEQPAPVRSFLFGRVAPLTTLGRFPYVEFVRETATSPYCNADSPGFAHEGGVVIRRLVIGQAFDPEFTILYRGMLQGIVAHECGHLFQRALSSETRPRWRAAMREDVCRFTQTPRSMGDLQLEFCTFFEAADRSHPMYRVLMADADPGMGLPDLLNELIVDGLVIRRPDGQFYCSLYEKGRRWLVR